MFINIQGYSGYYQINPEWNIKSIFHRDWKILSPWLWKSWYMTLVLIKDWIRKTYQLHRLKAIHFIPNPLNLPCINHIDWNKLNNDLDNLEWCTKSWNSKHAWKNWLMENARIWSRNVKVNYKRWSDHINSKSVLQIWPDGSTINVWWSMVEASNELWINQDHISRCCRWIRKKTGWFSWKYNF